MIEKLHQLGQLLFAAIPTVLIFVGLHFYLRKVLYGPLQRVLAARRERIEGRQEAAQKAQAAAEAKLAGYEDALRQRRQENYRRIEAKRQAGLAASVETLNAARQQAAQAQVAARQQLAAETAQARGQLQASAEGLAQQILQQILGGNAHRRTAPGAGA